MMEIKAAADRLERRSEVKEVDFDTLHASALLEWADRRYLLEGNCSLGRADLNTIVLNFPRASRFHAVIHFEETGQFWLIDLGSSNGTFLNKHRIQHPARLRDHDKIGIAGEILSFRRSPHETATLRKVLSQTVQVVENTVCWILLADLKDFTPLSRQTPSDKLADLIGRWLGKCKQIVEQHGGEVNKYLGDGILAFWREAPGVADQVAAVLAALKCMQADNDLLFRFVIHFGEVALGGPLREETLIGSEVNLAFRLEKVAAGLGEPAAISDTARKQLRDRINPRLTGMYELKGFEGTCALFAV